MATLELERDPSYCPVFQTMFTLLDDGAEQIGASQSWGGVSAHEDVAATLTKAKFYIDLNIVLGFFDGNDDVVRESCLTLFSSSRYFLADPVWLWKQLS